RRLPRGRPRDLLAETGAHVPALRLPAREGDPRAGHAAQHEHGPSTDREARRMTEPAEPLFFETPAESREWLHANHDRATEVWVGVIWWVGSAKREATRERRLRALIEDSAA